MEANIGGVGVARDGDYACPSGDLFFAEVGHCHCFVVRSLGENEDEEAGLRPAEK